MNGHDKNPSEPLVGSTSDMLIRSNFRDLDEHHETKSKSGASSYRSGMSGRSSQSGGGYSSRRMKKYRLFKEEEKKYQDNIAEAIRYCKYVQPVLGLVAAIFLTPWALLCFACLFLVLHLFK